jgi:hypothetical protein
MNIC